MYVVSVCAGDTGYVCMVVHTWVYEEGTMTGSPVQFSRESYGAWGRYLVGKYLLG